MPRRAAVRREVMPDAVLVTQLINKVASRRQESNRRAHCLRCIYDRRREGWRMPSLTSRRHG